MDQHEIFARSLLVLRIMDATGEGLRVRLVLANGKTYSVEEPRSSGGVLTFECADEKVVRVLENAIIAIEEDEPLLSGD